MPRYLCLFRNTDTAEELPLVITARCANDARSDARNNMNARRLDAVQWPMVSWAIVEETT